MRRAIPAAMAALPLLLALVACGPAPPPSGDVSLLPLAGATVDGGAPATASWVGGDHLPLDAPARVAVGESERLALLTRRGVRWEVPVHLRPGDRLRWAVAVGEGSDPATAGRLTLIDGRGRSTPVGRVDPPDAGTWREEEIVVDAAAQGRLRLASDGARPLAWAELRLVRGGAAGGGAASARPNVILVSFDTLRADRLSLYGHGRPTSPHLDRFAADALVFERALSSSTWTLPGHGSMFTGLLPERHGLTALETTLDPAAPTLASRLQRLGYRTVALTDGGFLGPRWGLSRGFDRYDTTPGQPWEPKDAAVIARRAAAWMEANRFEPYFLFLHSYETHQPYVNREGFADPWFTGDALPAPPPNILSLRPETLGADGVEQLRALYDGGVRRLDHYLGALLERWRDGGRLARTAVLVTSDHGEELGEHGAFEHAAGKVFDEHLRVPMIVRPPGGTAGRRSRVPVSSLDVAPTVLAWAGAAEERLVGRPLEELAAGEPREVERRIRERHIVVQGINSLPSLDEWNDRLDRGPWTLVSDRRRGRAAFFDRAADPAMEHPRTPAAAHADPEVPAVALVARLQTVLAWVAGDATHATPLPSAATAVRVDGGGGVVPRSVWDGLDRHAVEPGESKAALSAGVPALLTIDLERAAGGRRVWLYGVGAGDGGEELPLAGVRAWTADDWNPVAGHLPAPGEIFPTAPVLEAGSLELSEEARKELEALGYL